MIVFMEKSSHSLKDIAPGDYSCGEHNEINAILIIIMMMLLMLIIIMITISILVHGGEHVLPVLLSQGRQAETEPAMVKISW